MRHSASEARTAAGAPEEVPRPALPHGPEHPPEDRRRGPALARRHGHRDRSRPGRSYAAPRPRGRLRLCRRIRPPAHPFAPVRSAGSGKCASRPRRCADISASPPPVPDRPPWRTFHTTSPRRSSCGSSRSARASPGSCSCSRRRWPTGSRRRPERRTTAPSRSQCGTSWTRRFSSRSRLARSRRPQVDSAVVRLVPLPAPRVKVRDERFLFSVIRAAFGQRRKTLRNALRSIADAEALSAAGKDADIDLARRGETLSLDEFARLADFLFERTGRKG